VRDVLFQIEKVAGGALLTVLTATIFIQVLFRFVFDLPLAWSEEVSRYSFIWLTMVVAPICVRERANLGMDALVGRLQERTRYWLEFVGTVLMMVLASVMLVWGALILDVVRAQQSPALGVPMLWVYAAIPVGAGLMLVELAAILRDRLVALRDTTKSGRQ
jgi:TRAP-type C4-dicarboxylate transport system permease small subunit